jgi:hypothetical protein
MMPLIPFNQHPILVLIDIDPVITFFFHALSDSEPSWSRNISTSVVRPLSFLSPYAPAIIPISTAKQADHFLEHGFVTIKSAFTKEKAAEWTQKIWIRLGLDSTDKSTWDRERIHMPSHRREEVALFAPKVGIGFLKTRVSFSRSRYYRHGTLYRTFWEGQKELTRSPAHGGTRSL